MKPSADTRHTPLIDDLGRFADDGGPSHDWHDPEHDEQVAAMGNDDRRLPPQQGDAPEPRRQHS